MPLTGNLGGRLSPKHHGAAIRNGQREPAQRGLWLYRLNLEYQREWDGVRYAVQQVAAIVDEEEHRLVVVTVYTYYF